MASLLVDCCTHKGIVARQLHFTLALALELLLAQQAKKHTTVMNVVRNRVMNFLTVAMLQQGPDSTVILHDKQEIQILENVSTEMTISVSASFLTTVEWSFAPRAKMLCRWA